MGEKIQDEDFLPVIMDGGDQPEIIAADIEDGDGFPAFHLHLVGVGEHPASFDEILPGPGEHEAGPVLQRPDRLGKAPGIKAEGGSFDQAHSVDYMS